MSDLYRHTDYRAYLREWFEETKKEQSFLSYRYMARMTGIDAGYLAHVLQGNKHIAEPSIDAVADLLGLDERESRYFHELVLFSRARNEREIEERFQKLMSMRDTTARELSEKQRLYWSQWYFPAVRLLLLTFTFRGDYADLAARLSPPIQEMEARHAVETLERLGLVQQESDGSWVVLDVHISTGDAWRSVAIRDFQRQTLQLAIESLERHPPDLREISTLSLAIPQARIPALQEMVREFRKQMAKWALGHDDADCVVQVDLAVFPIGLQPRSGEQT